MHVGELQRMGADIRIDGRSAVVAVRPASHRGAGDGDRPARFGLPRASAGLVADGPTVIDRVYHLDRGYRVDGDQARRARGVDREIRA